MFRPLAAMLLIATLAACSSGPSPRDSGPSPASSAPSASVRAPNFSDAKPIANWGGRPPSAYEVHGVDVARYQSPIDWREAARNGVSFAFIKATEGGDMVDPMFAEHWAAAGRAGVPRGAYHFFYHCRPAAEQARWFIKHVPRVAGALPPVLDMEWTPFSPTCTIRRDGAVLRQEARIFLDIITRHYGQRPILYTSVDFFEDNQMWQVTEADFWLRAVAKHPRDLYSGHHWRFWQYTSTGLVPGIREEVDINVFEGSAAQWRAWLAANRR